MDFSLHTILHLYLVSPSTSGPNSHSQCYHLGRDLSAIPLAMWTHTRKSATLPGVYTETSISRDVCAQAFPDSKCSLPRLIKTFNVNAYGEGLEPRLHVHCMGYVLCQRKYSVHVHVCGTYMYMYVVHTCTCT